MRPIHSGFKVDFWVLDFLREPLKLLLKSNYANSDTGIGHRRAAIPSWKSDKYVRTG